VSKAPDWSIKIATPNKSILITYKDKIKYIALGSYTINPTHFASSGFVLLQTSGVWFYKTNDVFVNNVWTYTVGRRAHNNEIPFYIRNKVEFILKVSGI